MGAAVTQLAHDIAHQEARLETSNAAHVFSIVEVLALLQQRFDREQTRFIDE